MALVRWRNRQDMSPWSALRELENQFDRLFGESPEGRSLMAGDWIPTADLYETEDGYVLEADIPGLKKEDIEVTAVDNTVTIKGERKAEERDEDSKGYHRYERRYGMFQRTFEVPGGFDSGKVNAQYEDGVLRVHLPKREDQKPKQLQVTVK